jgi:hypothetical protein
MTVPSWVEDFCLLAFVGDPSGSLLAANIPLDGGEVATRKK